eukprot:Gb_38351 [translate_table: standard]
MVLSFLSLNFVVTNFLVCLNLSKSLGHPCKNPIVNFSVHLNLSNPKIGLPSSLVVLCRESNKHRSLRSHGPLGGYLKSHLVDVVRACWRNTYGATLEAGISCCIDRGCLPRKLKMMSKDLKKARVLGF